MKFTREIEFTANVFSYVPQYLIEARASEALKVIHTNIDGTVHCGQLEGDGSCSRSRLVAERELRCQPTPTS